MLNGIHLVDFGNHRDTRLTFGRMTALVGQNGAGKTNLMRGILRVAQIYQSEDATDELPDLTRKNTKGWALTASWAGQIGDDAGAWGLWSKRLGYTRWLWRTSIEGEHEVWTPNPDIDPKDIPTWGVVDQRTRYGDLPDKTGPLQRGEVVVPKNRNLPRRWTSHYFKTSGSYLQSPSYSESVPPILGQNCRDLAWVLAYLKGDKDEAFAEIISALRTVVPVVRRIRHRPVPVKLSEKKSIVINKQERSFDEEQQVMGQELRFDMASGEDLPTSAISEGTLVTLAVLTAIMQEGYNGEQTILLDDIESGLHPRAQRDIIKQLRRLQETRPELQIIFSTHSPYILDEMEPEDVWLLAPDAEGIAHAAQLSQHPDLERARGILTTGELWSAEGEDWVLDPARRARTTGAAEPVGASAN